MGEVGCLKDGNFQNLQVESTTILDVGNITISGATNTVTIPGTLKYQTSELPLITMMGLNPIWAFNFGDPSALASAAAAGAKATVLTPAGTLYNLSKCLENVANQTAVVTVAQGTVLFGEATSAGTDAAIAAGTTNTLIPANLNITRITGNLTADLTLGASSIDYQADQRSLAIFSGSNVFTATKKLTLTTHATSKLNAEGSELVVSAAGTDVMTRVTAPSDGDVTIVLTASAADTTILPGSYIYLIAEANTDAVSIKACIRTTGGTIGVSYAA